MAVVPVTRTWVAGEVVTAAHFNNNIRDVLNYLLAKPILQLRQTVSQNMTTAVWTSMTFTTEIVDSSGMHSNVSATSRATAVYPGYYQRWGQISVESNATGLRGVRWATNGTADPYSQFLMNALTGNITSPVVTPSIVFLNVGDYSEIQGLQTSGGTRASAVDDTAQSSYGLAWQSN